MHGFPIETYIYRGFSIAMFDYRSVHLVRINGRLQPTARHFTAKTYDGQSSCVVDYSYEGAGEGAEGMTLRCHQTWQWEIHSK